MGGGGAKRANSALAFRFSWLRDCTQCFHPWFQLYAPELSLFQASGQILHLVALSPWLKETFYWCRTGRRTSHVRGGLLATGESTSVSEMDLSTLTPPQKYRRKDNPVAPITQRQHTSRWEPASKKEVQICQWNLCKVFTIKITSQRLQQLWKWVLYPNLL